MSAVLLVLLLLFSMYVLQIALRWLSEKSATALFHRVEYIFIYFMVAQWNSATFSQFEHIAKRRRFYWSKTRFTFQIYFHILMSTAWIIALVEKSLLARGSWLRISCHVIHCAGGVDDAVLWAMFWRKVMKLKKQQASSPSFRVRDKRRRHCRGRFRLWLAPIANVTWYSGFNYPISQCRPSSSFFFFGFLVDVFCFSLFLIGRSRKKFIKISNKQTCVKNLFLLPKVRVVI